MAINPGLERQMYPGVGEFVAGKAIGRGENEASPFEKDFPSLKEGVGNPITPHGEGCSSRSRSQGGPRQLGNVISSLWTCSNWTSVRIRNGHLDHHARLNMMQSIMHTFQLRGSKQHSLNFLNHIQSSMVIEVEDNEELQNWMLQHTTWKWR
jgi:hypothetical protein